METIEELYIKTTEELYDDIQESDKNDFSIEEFENSMTLYYYKRDGAIYSWCTGINDMRTFGNSPFVTFLRKNERRYEKRYPRIPLCHQARQWLA